MLEIGTKLTLGPITFDEATVQSYISVVEDEAMSILNAGTDPKLVPPLALAAQFSAAVSQLQLPLSALHTAQEVEFLMPVPVGSVITCRVWCAGRRQHADVTFLHLEFEGRNDGDAPVIRGRSTLLVPDGVKP